MKRYFFVLGLFFLLGCGSEPKLSASFNTKVINGRAVSQPESPQIVRVLMNASDGMQYLCSGTVLDATHVLTAAHCFSFSILNTTIDKNGLGFEAAKQVFVHPNFFRDELTGANFNDVAIVETAAPLNLPALPILASRAVAIDDIVGIYGYGFDETGAIGNLRSGLMRVAIVTPNHIMAPFEESTACNGDSGGPATMGTYDELGNLLAVGVVGITSTGTVAGCGPGDVIYFTNLQDPGIYTFIQSVAPGAVVM